MNWELIGEISHAETFAEGSKIRELHRLLDAYGGTGKNAKVLAKFVCTHLAKYAKPNYTGTKRMALAR